MFLGKAFRATPISRHGHRALFVPLFLCLLALLPFLQSTFIWFDLKLSDLLFTSQAYFKRLSGHIDSEAPVLIVTKDQAFFQRFHRDPDRADFAELLKLLRSEKAGTVAFDFIFDTPGADPGKDAAFAQALTSFPMPLLATHFVNRGTQTFEKLSITDLEAARPPWPLPLQGDLARNAAAQGLINLPADLDSTVRYAPLAFFPADMSEFVPSLGFATWVASMIQENAESIAALAKTSAHRPAAELLVELATKGPHQFKSIGHYGLNALLRRLELQFLARTAGLALPEQAEALKKAANEIMTSRLAESTWLHLPTDPLPLTGSHEMPCLRLPFRKLAPPFKGDGIETISMGTILQTEADKTSPLLNHHLFFQAAPGQTAQKITLSEPHARSGSNSITGQVVTVSGKPVANAEILLTIAESGFWQINKTDAGGNFCLSGIPAGNCHIQITAFSGRNWQQGSARVRTRNDSSAQLPLLMFADCSTSLNLRSETLMTDKITAIVFGEPMPILNSNASGEVALQNLPEGFAIAGLAADSDELELSAGVIVNSAGSPVPDILVAVIPDNDFWTLRHYQEQQSAKRTDSIRFDNMPTSIDSRLALFSGDSKETGQKTVDISLFPAQTRQLTHLPPVSNEIKAECRLIFAGADKTVQNIVLVGETGLRFSTSSDKPLLVPAGRYMILTEQDGKRGIFRATRIKQKTVFVGSALPADQDFIVTPINFLDKSFPRVPGVNLHANLFAALKQHNFMRSVFFHSDNSPRAWPIMQFLLLLPLLLLLNRLFVSAGAIWGGTGVVCAAVLWLAAGTIMFLHQVLLPLFFPLLVFAGFGVSRGYLAWSISRRQERETRQTFGRFISSAVVDHILKTPDSLKPGGEKKELSVIFTDLAGFTSISEKLAPEELTELMNEYLGEMTKILFEFGGTLDKYIGDAIMGFWNHPAPQPDHAQRAVECAIHMQQKLGHLRRKWAERGLPRVEMRAGINTSVCMVGFIGSEIQMNFTCLGDGVNLASRLEGANKAYGTFMMISDSVHNRIDQKLISTRFLDFLAVKGKDRPVEVFEVRGYRANEPVEWEKAAQYYKDGIDLYLKRSWADAIEAFSLVRQLLPDDGPAQVYIDRCREFSMAPPPKNWDGRYILRNK